MSMFGGVWATLQHVQIVDVRTRLVDGKVSGFEERPMVQSSGASTVLLSPSE